MCVHVLACVCVCVWVDDLILSQTLLFFFFFQLVVTEDLTEIMWQCPNYSFDPPYFDHTNIKHGLVCVVACRRPLEMPQNLHLHLPRTHSLPSWSPQKSRQHTRSSGLRYGVQKLVYMTSRIFFTKLWCYKYTLLLGVCITFPFVLFMFTRCLMAQQQRNEVLSFTQCFPHCCLSVLCGIVYNSVCSATPHL